MNNFIRWFTSMTSYSNMISFFFLVILIIAAWIRISLSSWMFFVNLVYYWIREDKSMRGSSVLKSQLNSYVPGLVSIISCGIYLRVGIKKDFYRVNSTMSYSSLMLRCEACAAYRSIHAWMRLHFILIVRWEVCIYKTSLVS